MVNWKSQTSECHVYFLINAYFKCIKILEFVYAWHDIRITTRIYQMPLDRPPGGLCTRMAVFPSLSSSICAPLRLKEESCKLRTPLRVVPLRKLPGSWPLGAASCCSKMMLFTGLALCSFGCFGYCTPLGGGGICYTSAACLPLRSTLKGPANLARWLMAP